MPAAGAESRVALRCDTAQNPPPMYAHLVTVALLHLFVAISLAATFVAVGVNVLVEPGGSGVEGTQGMLLFIAGGLVTFAFVVMPVAAGVGLMNRRQWARMITIGMGIAYALIAVPMMDRAGGWVLLAVSAYTLFALYRRDVVAEFAARATDAAGANAAAPVVTVASVAADPAPAIPDATPPSRN